MTIQMKATEQYFPVVLFIMLYKVVLTFESVDEILNCDHTKWKLLSSTVGLFIIICKVFLKGWLHKWNLKVLPLKRKQLNRTMDGMKRLDWLTWSRTCTKMAHNTNKSIGMCWKFTFVILQFTREKPQQFYWNVFVTSKYQNGGIAS